MIVSGLWTAFSIGLLTSEYENAITAARLGEIIGSLADQALMLAGSGAVLGVGVGLIVSGGGVYLYKRHQIRSKLES